MAEMRCCDEWQPVLVMVTIDFALAVVNILLKKIIDEGIDHLVLITYRTSISAAFLTPIAYFWERKRRPSLTRGLLCYLFVSAMLGATLTQYFFFLGMQYTSATFACAFINMVPVITFVMALPFGLETVDLKSKPGKAKVLGTIVCVGGAMLLTFYKGIPLTNQSSHSRPASANMTNQAHGLSQNQKGAERWTIGSLSLIAGALFWSAWFLVQAKISKKYPFQYSSTAIMSFFGALQSATLSSIIHRDIHIWIVKGKIKILMVLYTGIVGSGLCYVGMSWCVKKRGPLFTAAFSPLIQIIVAMFDISILHGKLYLGSVLGSILVIIGLYLLLWGKSNEVKLCDAKPTQTTDEEGGPVPPA
ncbi:hypothetical protein GIB67_033233 [Kingdonia uniflora]|uniref:WAT1-related protein n=1 Tax=Kingdonia uniflora TaxID=39325 RepID=A0A7J7MPK1_9MAGN|nr:hypothetical protein GIB67_033233 [Kingdonia uniflora]